MIGRERGVKDTLYVNIGITVINSKRIVDGQAIRTFRSSRFFCDYGQAGGR